MNSIDNRDLLAMFNLTADLQHTVAVSIQQSQCDVTNNGDLSSSAKVEAIIRLQRIQDAWLRRISKELNMLDELIVR